MAMWENSSQMWENPNVGKSVKILGKLWENCGKIVGKLWGNCGKIVGKRRQMWENMWENLAPVFAKHVGKLRECDSAQSAVHPAVA